MNCILYENSNKTFKKMILGNVLSKNLSRMGYTQHDIWEKIPGDILLTSWMMWLAQLKQQHVGIKLVLKIYGTVERFIPHSILLHLGLVSSNRIAWNASLDCPLSEHSIPPETLRGQWPPLRAIATRPRGI